MSILDRIPTATLRILLLLVSAATILSGAFQAVAPGVVLHVLSVDRTDATRQLFATIGLFMVAFGGMLLHALLAGDGDTVLVLWAGVQKFLAAVAVAIGVGRNVFSALALLVASFDLVSGLLCLLYRQRLARTARTVPTATVAPPWTST